VTNPNQHNNTCECGNTINSPCHEVCVHCAHAGVYECDSCGRGMQTDKRLCTSCDEYQNPTPIEPDDEPLGPPSYSHDEITVDLWLPTVTVPWNEIPYDKCDKDNSV